MKRGTLFMFMLGLACICACRRSAESDFSAPENFTLAAVDGIQLAATFYPVPADKPPGLILVHMLGADRRVWESFARRAQGLGYACLAFDLRGHGESTLWNGQRLSYRNFSTQDWLAAAQDIDAAKQALIAHGANPRNIALAGASIGANLALTYAQDHKDIPALILVSPGLDYKGVKTESAITAYGERPVLLLTAEGDSYSAASCAALKRAASGLCELREYPGAAHGTALFDASASALEQTFLWLRPILRAEH